MYKYGQPSAGNTSSFTPQSEITPKHSLAGIFSRIGSSVMLGLRREQFIACTWSVARGHVRKEKDKAEVVGNNKAFEVSDRSTLTSLDELKLLAG
jgi:hypothetical protein